MIGVGTQVINKKAKKYINEILKSKRISYGPFLKRFEKKFGDIHKSPLVIASNSGTSALYVAIQSLKKRYKWKDGDEIIVPSITFVATINTIIHNNLKPVIVDVDRDYYELNPNLIAEKITRKTRAIIPVHLFGQPCDMDPIMQIAKIHKLKVIEDSCETMFAKYKGQFTGTFGEIGCFSTYVAHLISTGVGGLNTTKDPKLAVQLRSLINHGRDSIYISIDDAKGKTKKEVQKIVKKRFSFVELGHSFRITEFEGALGLAQLDDWEKMIEKRRSNASYLIKHLSELRDKIQLPSIREYTEHSFMMFPIVLFRENKRRIINLLEENGIETRDMLPLTNQPVYKKYLNIKEKDYPVARWINNCGFYIGCHQDLTKKDLDKIIRIFKEVI